MESIYGTYPVTYRGIEAGTLEIKRSGIRTVFSCICRRVSDRIVRLYCICSEKAVSVGVMMPCAGGISLSKTFTDNAVTEMGLGAISSVVLSETTPEICRDEEKFDSDSGWRHEPEPWRLFTDEALIASCGKIKGAYTKRDGDTVFFAVPISPTEPFPAMPIFCFGTLERIGTRDYIVFKMKDGKFI